MTSTTADELNQFQLVAVLQQGSRMVVRCQYFPVQFDDDPFRSELQLAEQFSDVKGSGESSVLSVDINLHLVPQMVNSIH